MTIADAAIIALFALLALLIAVELVRPVRTFASLVIGWRRTISKLLQNLRVPTGA